MTTPTQGLQFICRGCRKAISQSLQLRTFSSSASRSKTIPKFGPTAYPELDALLLDWRRRVFTPASLNKTHQALVYKKSRHSIIDNDPGVTVTMSDGEEIKLEPLNNYDKPNKKDAMSQIIEILGSTNDLEAWSQLPAFLEGLKIAKLHLPVWFLEKLTRKANEQGRAGIIKQCAAMVRQTGLSLSLKPVTRELFLGCHTRFVQTRYLGEDFEKECNFASSLALMLQSDSHCGNVVSASDLVCDMRRDLTVLGVLLELAAARAIHVHAGKDVDRSVGRYSQQLIALTGPDFVKREGKLTSSQALENWLPLANGIRLALKVDGLVIGQGRNAEAELKTALKDRLVLLDRGIEEETANLKAEAAGKPRRALAMLESLRQVQ